MLCLKATAYGIWSALVTNSGLTWWLHSNFCEWITLCITLKGLFLFHILLQTLKVNIQKWWINRRANWNLKKLKKIQMIHGCLRVNQSDFPRWREDILIARSHNADITRNIESRSCYAISYTVPSSRRSNAFYSPRAYLREITRYFISLSFTRFFAWA